MREHSRLELERKLTPHATSEQELVEVLDFLQNKDFLNEQRVVESVISRRAAKQGAAKVKQELTQKGLDPEQIIQAVEQLRETEYERAHQLWLRKFGEVTQDPKIKAKQIRFLVSRGFAAGVVSKIVGGREDES
jgi:regulatory protein